jgi:hypothetical protein
VRLDVALDHLLKFPWCLVEGHVVLGENLRHGASFSRSAGLASFILSLSMIWRADTQFAPFALELCAVSRRHMRAKLRLSLD